MAQRNPIPTVFSAATVGWSSLRRTGDRIRATSTASGLEPGGVYTFWIIAVQEDGTFPDDIFVALGAGTIANRNGKAAVHMSARVGDESINGFKPDGVNELQFADLADTVDSVVRIEVAYHGQARDAGGDLGAWLSDFWTGTACPPGTPNPNPAQPHCPVYFAATHTP